MFGKDLVNWPVPGPFKTLARGAVGSSCLQTCGQAPVRLLATAPGCSIALRVALTDEVRSQPAGPEAPHARAQCARHSGATRWVSSAITHRWRRSFFLAHALACGTPCHSARLPFVQSKRLVFAEARPANNTRRELVHSLWPHCERRLAFLRLAAVDTLKA